MCTKNEERRDSVTIKYLFSPSLGLLLSAEASATGTVTPWPKIIYFFFFALFLYHVSEPIRDANWLILWM